MRNILLSVRVQDEFCSPALKTLYSVLLFVVVVVVILSK